MWTPCIQSSSKTWDLILSTITYKTCLLVLLLLLRNKQKYYLHHDWLDGHEPSFDALVDDGTAEKKNARVSDSGRHGSMRQVLAADNTSDNTAV